MIISLIITLCEPMIVETLCTNMGQVIWIIMANRIVWVLKSILLGWIKCDSNSKRCDLFYEECSESYSSPPGLMPGVVLIDFINEELIHQ